MSTETLDEFPRWPPIFAKRRQFNRKAENQPYIEWMQTQKWDGEDDEYGEDDEDEDDEDEDDMSGDDEYGSVLSEQDDKVEKRGIKGEVKNEGLKDDQDGEANSRPSEVRVFMTGLTGDEDALPYRDQVEEVASFCEQAKVRDFGNKPGEGGKHVALLDDRNIRGTVLVNKGTSPPGECRPYLGPLTLQELEEELRKKRLKVAFEDEGIDAERRVVFMTDLDPSTIKAIAKTASRTQAPALKDLFYKHLTGKTSIGVTIPYQGFTTFSLDFHIPFYVLKVGKELLKDTRSRADGTPLRQCWDLPFMSAPTGTSKSIDGRCCLYEAQISIAVTGIDQWVWSAYAIIDVYVESEETVDIYDQLTRRSRRFSRRRRPDPLATGRILADEPIWTPREYFLKVIEIRMIQILREWNYIVDQVERDIKRSTNHIFPISSSINDPMSRKQVREFSSKNTKMVRLLRQLIASLSTTVEAWAEFSRRDIGYFRPEGEPPPTSPPLKPLIDAVEKTFWKLNGLRRKLQKLKKDLCEDNPQGLHAHLSIENNEAAIYQQKAAGNIEILTVITIFFFPLVLAANLFSTTGVLPFKPTFANFICAMIVLGILVLATLVVLSKWRFWLDQIVAYAQKAIIWYNERQVVEGINGGVGASPKPLTQKWVSRRNTNGDIEMATFRQRQPELEHS